MNRTPRIDLTRAFVWLVLVPASIVIGWTIIGLVAYAAWVGMR